MSSLMVNVALVGLVLAGLTYFVAGLTRKKMVETIALLILIFAGPGASFLAIFFRGLEAGHAPMTNLYETLLIFAWGLSVAGVISHAAFKNPAVGGLCAAAAVLVLGGAALGAGAELRPLMPALKSNWVTVHVAAYMIGYGACGAAAIADVVCLIVSLRALPHSKDEKRMEKVASYDRLAHWLVSLAYPLLTVGLITGAIWAKQAWGDYWSWDPKETWSLITWLAYGIYFHSTITFRGLRVSSKISPRSAIIRSVLRLVSFAILLFTFLGLNYLPSAKESLHLYQ